MDAVTLIERARAAGLTVRADGDRLIVHGPKAAEALVHELAAHKAEVLRLLAPPADADDDNAHLDLRPDRAHDHGL